MLLVIESFYAVSVYITFSAEKYFWRIKPMFCTLACKRWPRPLNRGDRLIEVRLIQVKQGRLIQVWLYLFLQIWCYVFEKKTYGKKLCQFYSKVSLLKSGWWHINKRSHFFMSTMNSLKWWINLSVSVKTELFACFFLENVAKIKKKKQNKNKTNTEQYLQTSMQKIGLILQKLHFGGISDIVSLAAGKPSIIVN